MGILLLAWSPALAGVQSQKAGAVTSLTGVATVAHASLPPPVPLKVPDDVFFHDRIDTRERSTVQILLRGKAVLTIRELSSATLEAQPQRATVDLTWGRLALRLLRNLVPAGEAVEVQTPNAVAAVRGSLLIVEVGGSVDDPQTTFKAIEAHVPILITARAGPKRTVSLAPNQAVSIFGRGKAVRFSPVRPLSPTEARRAARIAEAVHHPGHARKAGKAQDPHRLKNDKPEPARRHPSRSPEEKRRVLPGHAPGKAGSQAAIAEDRAALQHDHQGLRQDRTDLREARGDLRKDSRGLREDRPGPGHNAWSQPQRK